MENGSRKNSLNYLGQWTSIFHFHLEIKKMGNGRSFFTVHFPTSMENENNGMYTDLFTHGCSFNDSCIHDFYTDWKYTSLANSIKMVGLLPHSLFWTRKRIAIKTQKWSKDTPMVDKQVASTTHQVLLTKHAIMTVYESRSSRSKTRLDTSLYSTTPVNCMSWKASAPSVSWQLTCALTPVSRSLTDRWATNDPAGAFSGTENRWRWLRSEWTLRIGGWSLASRTRTMTRV